MKIYEWSPLFMADSGSASGTSTTGAGNYGNTGPGADYLSRFTGGAKGGIVQIPTTPPTPQGPIGAPAGTIPPPAPGETPEQAAAREQAQAEDYAKTQAGISSAQAGRESAGYARSQGLNPAQAALLSSTSAGNTFGTSYGTNLYNKLGLDLQKYGINKNSDTQRYGIDTNARVQTYGIDKGYQQNQNQLNQQNDNNLWSAIGTGASVLGGLLFSDENLKEDIKDGYGILDRVTRVVNPKTFKMKGDKETQTGVMAQDLEKTPLASTVVNTPEGKMVDTRKLTTANTAMLSDLSKKVDTLYNFLKEASGGPARAS